MGRINGWIIIGLLLGSPYAQAGCNLANAGNLTLSITGSVNIAVGSTNLFGISGTENYPGTFTWTYNGFTPLGSTSSTTIKLVAPDKPNTNMLIECEFNPTQDSSGDCSAETNVTVWAKKYAYVGFGADCEDDLTPLAAYMSELDASYDEDGSLWTYTNSAIATITITEIVDAFGFIDALEKKDAYVAFTGHANYGTGLAFNDHSATLGGLVNIGDNTTGVIWEVLKSHLPNLFFPTISIANSPENYITGCGMERHPNEAGTYQGHLLEVIGPNSPNNVFATIYESGTNSFHYYNNSEPYVIIQNAASDLPANPKYEWILLATCYSGMYYADNLSHGTVFFSESPVYVGSGEVKVFVQAIIEGKNEEWLMGELNECHPAGVEVIYDYQ